MSAFDPAMSSGASTGFSHGASALPQGTFTAAAQGGTDQGVDHGHRPNYQTLRVHNTEPPADALGNGMLSPTPMAQQTHQLTAPTMTAQMLDPGAMKAGPIGRFDPNYQEPQMGKFTPYEPGQVPMASNMPPPPPLQQQQQQIAGAMATGMAIASAGRSSGGSDDDPGTNSAEEQNRQALRAPRSLEDLAAAEGRAERLAQQRAKFYRNRAPGMGGPSMEA